MVTIAGRRVGASNEIPSTRQNNNRITHSSGRLFIRRVGSSPYYFCRVFVGKRIRVTASPSIRPSTVSLYTDGSGILTLYYYTGGHARSYIIWFDVKSHYQSLLFSLHITVDTHTHTHGRSVRLGRNYYYYYYYSLSVNGSNSIYSTQTGDRCVTARHLRRRRRR